MLLQERTVAESPQHTDAGHATGSGGGDVNLAVAHIDGMLAANAQQALTFSVLRFFIVCSFPVCCFGMEVPAPAGASEIE